MKRIIVLIALLVASQAWAIEPIALNAPMTMGGASTVVAASGECSVDTDYIGNKDVSGSTAAVAAGISRCYLFSASCSGTLTAGYIRHTSTSAYSAKICVYSTDGDDPDGGDTIVSSDPLSCSSNITGTTANNWDTAAMGGGTVVKDTSYYLCLFIDDDSANALDIDGDSSTTSTLWYYGTPRDDYDTPPANLDNGGPWNEQGSFSNRSFYVSIGPTP